MKKTKSIISLLLLSSLLSAVACGGSDSPSGTDNGNGTTSDIPTEIETGDPNDPQLESRDYNGLEFCILYGDNDFEPNLDVCAEETNGEPLNDAIYARNCAIEEKYNIDITWNRFTYWDAFPELSRSVLAGDNQYMLNINNGVYSYSAAVNGYLHEVNGIPNIDFTKPYWNSNMLDGSSINKKNYFVYSDINIHALGATPCVLFNKNVADSHGIDDLYQLTAEGKWTFDAMKNYIKAVTHDLDGDGAITESDMHGFIGNNFVIDCFLSGTGYQTVTKDENDLPKLNIQTEKYYNIITAIQDICSEETGSFMCDRYAGVDREYAPMDALEQDRALFWIANLKGVQRMRNMESPFGLLPIPKLDENQENYKIHYQVNIGGAMSIPITVEDLDMVGAVLEDMSYLSMKQVKPVYVDVLLQGKFLRDDESLLTLEIMFDSYYSDLGFMIGGAGISITGDLRNYVQYNSTDYVSQIEKLMSSYTEKLNKSIDIYLQNE